MLLELSSLQKATASVSREASIRPHARAFSYLRWSLSPLMVLVAPSCTYLKKRHDVVSTGKRRRDRNRETGTETHFQSLVLMLSFQPASHDTYWLWMTAFQLWPGGGAGTAASFPMLMMTSSACMRRCMTS